MTPNTGGFSYFLIIIIITTTTTTTTTIIIIIIIANNNNNNKIIITKIIITATMIIIINNNNNSRCIWKDDCECILFRLHPQGSNVHCNSHVKFKSVANEFKFLRCGNKVLMNKK